MATVEECRNAVEELAERMRGSGQKASMGDRTLSCHVPDLDITFSGVLRAGQLADITDEPQAERAQIRVTANSDDLVALVAGDLDMARAWLTKRIKIQASMVDLVKLRTMF